MNTSITQAQLIAAIEPNLAAERQALAAGDPSWDLPEFSEARRLTAELGMQWDFDGWEDALNCIKTHSELGGVAVNLYLAKIDNGEGGSTKFRAINCDEALEEAMSWAKAGDWSENNNAHVSGVTVSVRNIEDADDYADDHFYPEKGAAK
jgi:hypothetical protein